ncbi:hypothetical protein LKV13_00630 [Borrelia sp. BU AG58]|uniref:tetratricopeptide repeat protein n=1 Tax=Borrelia sp. BU AG58 TaxID=2887345 RepID=UPI001E49D29F|nr:hypothetical protein [Borrelia sp. BU AG58]UER67334.1 hypothetical protein LKV13_00630 [Borrelia sp. BU AG58]
MFKGRVFIGILLIIVFVGIVVVFYISMDVDYVKTGGEIVEKLEGDLNLYLRGKSDEEKGRIELRIKEYIGMVADVSHEFFPRFYLARSTYYQSKGLYREALDDLDIVLNSKWIEREIAYLNKAVIYEKMGQMEDALLAYDNLIKKTKFEFMKIKALLGKALIFEDKDKDVAVSVYEQISNFSYENNLYVNIAKNKLLQLK